MMTPLLATTLVRADHVRSFHIAPARPAGWEACEHQDQRVVQQQSLTRFTRDIAELREQGWREA
jgi:hypothetical protein